MNDSRFNCNTLENIYNLMNIKNKPNTNNDILYDSTLNNIESYKKNYCYAIYSLDSWYLNHSWRRLNNWLKTFITSDLATLYSVNPSNNEGRLHQTLLQIIDFKNANTYTKENIDKTLTICKDIMDTSGFSIRIIYRGLVFTKSGLALSGYPYDSKDYTKIMNLRDTIEKTLLSLNMPCNIPYKNDILHATLLRWKTPPSQEVIDILNSSLHKWDECVFGEVRISKYSIGKASEVKIYIKTRYP